MREREEQKKKKKKALLLRDPHTTRLPLQLRYLQQRRLHSLLCTGYTEHIKC
jgi:hypothetical protein